MRKLETIKDLHAEKAALQLAARELENSMTFKMRELSKRMNPLFMLFDFVNFKDSSGILKSVIPFVPVIGKVLKKKTSLWAALGLIAGEILINRMNVKIGEKIFGIIGKRFFKQR
jgi:hypothetical protein